MNANHIKSLPETLLTEVEHIFGQRNITNLSLNKVLKTVISYYENILNCMPGNVYWLDQNCCALGCNQNVLDMLGLESIAEFKSLSLEEMGRIGKWSEEAIMSFKQDSLAVIQTGKSKLNIEEPPIPNNRGDFIYFLTHRVPLFDDQQKVIGLVGISIDITQRKKLEKELLEEKHKAEAANLAKSAFIANMSHDIRTPLNGVIGMAQILEERILSSDDKQYARWINESGNQLMFLLNNILEVISLDQVDEQIVHKDTFSIMALVKDIIELEQPSILIKKLALNVTIDEKLPKLIISDRIKLHRILLNLLGNAIKFTQQGVVELIIMQDKETPVDVTVSFVIKDTGIGIQKSIQNKIFDRFFRVSPSEKGHYQGHGVGLHIVQNFVQLLGGKINVVSEEGRGSTFSFKLTFKKALSNKHANIECVTLTKTDDKKNLAINTKVIQPILLIEDNPIALKLLEHLISKLDYPYKSFKSSEEALHYLKDHQTTLIITDIGLPGLSGIDLTKLVKKTVSSNPSIVGLTAHAPQEIIETCLQAGMSTVLTKPVDFQKLTQVINSFLFSGSDDQTNAATLGRDLPATEKELFDIEHLAILDIQKASDLLGGKEILQEMLQLMVVEQIPNDLPLLKKAYQIKDWDQIEALAHKMKAGALYCGTMQLQIACQYLERYRKAGHKKLLNSLYEQLIRIIEITSSAIEQYLQKN